MSDHHGGATSGGSSPLGVSGQPCTVECTMGTATLLPSRPSVYPVGPQLPFLSPRIS